MAATDYTSQGFGTYVWTDPDQAGNKWDGNPPIYGGPLHGYVQHSPFAYDPSSGKWLWVKSPEDAGNDYVCYVYYSNVTTDMASITSWTQCTTNIPNATTADPSQSQAITYDSDNDRFHMLYIIYDNSVAEWESRSAMFTFSGTDITLIYDEQLTWGDTDRWEAGLYRTMDTVNETDTTPTPAADDGRTVRIVNRSAAGDQGLYTSFIDISASQELSSIGNGPAISGSTYPLILSEHAGDIRRWFDYADMYNTTQNDMMLHQVESNTAKAYQMKWEGTTQHEVYTTATTGTTAVDATGMTNSTTTPYATAFYDNTTAKFYSFGVGNNQSTGGVETAMKSSSDFGATWSADLTNGQDAGDLIETWNSTDTAPVTYILFTHAKNGKAYICIRDNHTETIYANYAIILLEYNCVNDSWSTFATLTPPSGQTSSSEKVIGAWVDDTKSFVIVGVHHAGDNETYFYVKQLDWAAGGAPSAWGVWGT